MKHQYVGDISDYRKYALLRALSANGTNRIGICWMLTPDDRRSDGNKLGYLTRPDEFRACDPELFDLLSSAAAAPDRRRLSQIEESGIVPSAVYVNDTLPDDLAGRLMFMKQARQMVVNTDLVFFDPDNGMETSLPKGRKNSNKFVYMDELAAFYETGKSLLVYQHFPRVERAAFISSCAERIENAARARPYGPSRHPTSSFYWPFIPIVRLGSQLQPCLHVGDGSRSSCCGDWSMGDTLGQQPLSRRFLIFRQTLAPIFLSIAAGRLVQWQPRSPARRQLLGGSTRPNKWVMPARWLSQQN